MEGSTSPSRSSTKSGRRSFPNLTHLSLAPLSSRFPIDDDEYEEKEFQYELPKTSYIQGKSAPTTPRILAGGSKPRVKPKKSRYAYDSYFPAVDGSVDRPIAKAKSASALAAHQDRRGNPEDNNNNNTISPLLSHQFPRPTTHQTNDEWLHRAGLVIASETRVSKGQSWLTSRESSTSLVQQNKDDDDDDGDDNDSLFPRHSSEDGVGSGHHSLRPSRVGSRAGSRVASARPSRRGSRVGSRVDFLMPFDARTPDAAVVDGYFEEELTMGPDFVNVEDEEGIAADEEIQRLSKAQAFGIGGLVDRLMGWPLFNVDEDSEDEEKLKEDETAEELLKRKQRELRRRKEELARAASSSAIATMPQVIVQPPRQNQEEEGGWNDVTWLLSVASKVVL